MTNPAPLARRCGRSPRLAAALLWLPLAACAARAPVPAGTPVADPAAEAAALQRATTSASPQQVTFAWSLDEAGSQVRGRGVARVLPGRRIRLDLFGPRGETYLAAALVDGEMRLPPAVAGQLQLPSPALLWAALGTVQPPEGAALEGATRADSLLTLRYRTPGGDALHFVAAAGAAPARLLRVERIGGSGVLESVQLDYAAGGELQRTRYRDWAAYRELVLTPEEIRDVDAFPESIWRPDGPAR